MNPHTFPFVVEDDDGKTILSVTMRRPTIDDQMEFRAALDQGLSRAITKILTTCTVDAKDSGPWLATPGADGEDLACPVDWDRVSTGLRMRALFTLKFNSKKDGHLIEVDMICPSCPRDDNKFTTVVDARSIPDGELLWGDPEDIPEVLEAIVSPSKTIEAMVGETRVAIKAPPCGVDEQKIEDFPKTASKKLSTEQVKKEMGFAAKASRLDSVDGIHRNDIKRWVKGLSAEEYDELEAVLDAADWGVELSFETKCPRGHEMDGELPFVYLFGRPQTKMQALRKRRLERAMKKKKRSASQE